MKRQRSVHPLLSVTTQKTRILNVKMRTQISQFPHPLERGGGRQQYCREEKTREEKLQTVLVIKALFPGVAVT